MSVLPTPATCWREAAAKMVLTSLHVCVHSPGLASSVKEDSYVDRVRVYTKRNLR